MGLELELLELAALRPIRTAVSGATMTRRGYGGGVAAADNIGCATPTEGGAMMTRRDGSEDGADTGCVTPTASGATARQDGGKEGTADSGCVTPTSGATALRPVTVCPPAPRKPRPAKRKRCGLPVPPPQRSFFPVPHDLAAVFVPRVAASPCPSAKKIQVHSVG